MKSLVLVVVKELEVKRVRRKNETRTNDEEKKSLMFFVTLVNNQLNCLVAPFVVKYDQLVGCYFGLVGW